MVHSTLIPVFLVLGVTAVLHLSFYFYDLYQKKNQPHPPAASQNIRGPGKSLLKQIDQVNEDLQRCFISLILAPTLILAAHLFYSKLGHATESWIRTVISLGGCLTFVIYYLSKLHRLRSMRRRLRLGYDGAVAVARELNQMMSKGYQVFHDFPGEGFSIDHILIGPSGVMAVKTKTHSKGISHKRKGDAVVTYDGRMLHFPKYSDYQSIDQAIQHAEWLSKWISAAIGEDICVRAMVALPDWSVKRTSADGIPVVNPKQFETLFTHLKPRPLTEITIDRIVHQFDQQCREAKSQSNSCYSIPQ